MSYSIKIIFISQSKSSKLGTLYIRTISNRKSRKRSLRIKISKAQFDRYFNHNTQRFRTVKEIPEFIRYNQLIDDAFSELDSFHKEFDTIPSKDKSFLKYYKRYISSIINHGSRIKHYTVFGKLNKFLIHDYGREYDLKFIDLNPLFFESLHRYLLSAADPKTLSINTANHYLKMIKGVVDHAVKAGYYYYTINPFATIHFKTEKKEKPYLPLEEIKKLTSRKKLDDPRLELALQIFLFQLNANGMRISDTLKLRWSCIVDNRINYKMLKSSKNMSIPINPNMASIMLALIGSNDQITNINDNKMFSIKHDQNYVEYKKSERKSVAENEYSLISMNTWNKFISYMISQSRNLKNESKYSDSFVTMVDYQSANDSGENFSYHGYVIRKSDNTLKHLIDIKVEFQKKIGRFTQHLLRNAIDKIKNTNDFIFPILDNENFKNVRDLNRLSENQYKEIKHKTIVYNRHLKTLKQKLNINGTMTAHTPRHSFTNILLNLDSVNLYDISQSLGHANIKITDNYVKNGFNSSRVDYINKKLSDELIDDFI